MTLDEFDNLKVGAMVKLTKNQITYHKQVVEKVFPKGTIGHVTEIHGKVDHVGGSWYTCNGCYLIVYINDYKYGLSIGVEEVDLI